MSEIAERIGQLLADLETALEAGEDPRTAGGIIRHMEMHSTPAQLMHLQRITRKAAVKFPGGPKQGAPAGHIAQIIARAMGGR